MQLVIAGHDATPGQFFPSFLCVRRADGIERSGVFAAIVIWDSCSVNHLAKPFVRRRVARRAEDIRLAAWWKLLTAHAIMMQRVGRDLAATTGLPLSSYNVLRLLHEAPAGRLRLSELARAVHLTRSGVTRLANRLEKTGMLHREGHARDRRSSCAVLTERGRTEWRKARAVFVRAVAEHFGNHLSDGEAETLNLVLSRIASADTRGDCQ